MTLTARRATAGASEPKLLPPAFQPVKVHREEGNGQENRPDCVVCYAFEGIGREQAGKVSLTLENYLTGYACSPLSGGETSMI